MDTVATRARGSEGDDAIAGETGASIGCEDESSHCQRTCAENGVTVPTRRAPTRVLHVKIRRADAALLTTSAVTELASGFGAVESVRVDGNKVRLSFTTRPQLFRVTMSTVGGGPAQVIATRQQQQNSHRYADRFCTSSLTHSRTNSQLTRSLTRVFTHSPVCDFAKAVVVFSDASDAAQMQTYLATSKRCRGFGHARLFGAFIDDDLAGTVGLSSVDRIPSVSSDPIEGVRAAAAATGLSGVTLVHDFLSQEHEAMLLDELDRDELWDTGPASTRASRRTQHFGHDYDYALQGADARVAPRPLPPLIAHIAERVHAAVGPDTPPFDQVTLQEYLPAAGIPPHIDTVWAFGDVLASVSLLSGCVMRFRPVFGVVANPDAYADLWMPPRSLLLMTGSARYSHTHSIPARKHDVVDGVAVPRARRLSLSLRQMTGQMPPRLVHQ